MKKREIFDGKTNNKKWVTANKQDGFEERERGCGVGEYPGKKGV